MSMPNDRRLPGWHLLDLARCPTSVMRSKVDLGHPLPTNFYLQVFDGTSSPFMPYRISRSITQIAGSAVTRRASGVSSGIFVHQDYRLVWHRKELSASDDRELT